MVWLTVFIRVRDHFLQRKLHPTRLGFLQIKGPTIPFRESPPDGPIEPYTASPIAATGDNNDTD